jgi:hypothetical protein
MGKQWLPCRTLPTCACAALRGRQWAVGANCHSSCMGLGSCTFCSICFLYLSVFFLEAITCVGAVCRI